VQDYEKLGLFYIGRRYDITRRELLDEPVLYDSRDLVTHAICVGMTGSGKTGLCIGILEEAAIDGVPVIAIDPKGDLSNMLLTFPRLAPEEFEPWVNPDEAARQNITVGELARRQAELWRNGLAQWGQSGERIERLRNAAEFVVYTPGSSAGVPVSILESFAAPSAAVRDDPELLAERVETATTSLLALIGVEAEPMRSREHVLLANLLTESWKAGRNVDLASLIQQIQKPPMARVGVLDLESFYPEGDRFQLAMRVNQLLAAPGFEIWLQGEPLDIDRILYTPAGKPRVAVFSIAHLDEPQRMFFVSLLLNQVLGWMRGQSGTTSLRAVLYMDEIFGYFPPVANPPSKAPLLTLLKQARAFGLGVVLATQNPVDLDYKGLGNTGTWLLGRLQTERDKARVLDGLESAAGTAGRFDRQQIDATLSALTSRVFFVHNVHEDAPVVMQSRWTLSYLRGPLTRDQIRVLMASRKAAAPAPPPASPGAPAGAGPAPASADVADRPVLPPDIPAYYVAASGTPRYAPFFYGSARVHFSDSKLGVDETRDLSFLVPVLEGPQPVDWDHAKAVGIPASSLLASPPAGATFGPLPAAATKAKHFERWSKDFSRWVAQTQRLTLFASPATGETSRPGESERDFRVRLMGLARERRDEVTDLIRQKYAAKAAALAERRRRAEAAIGREQEQASAAKVQTAVSFGATILGALFGRKRVSTSTLGRATTAARGVGRSTKEAQDVQRARESLAAIDDQVAALDARIHGEIEAALASLHPSVEELRPVDVKPKRGGVTVEVAALAWAEGTERL
jgi:hypothetical protein